MSRKKVCDTEREFFGVAMMSKKQLLCVTTLSFTKAEKEKEFSQSGY